MIVAINSLAMLVLYGVLGGLLSSISASLDLRSVQAAAVIASVTRGFALG